MKRKRVEPVEDIEEQILEYGTLGKKKEDHSLASFFDQRYFFQIVYELCFRSRSEEDANNIIETLNMLGPSNLNLEEEFLGYKDIERFVVRSQNRGSEEFKNNLKNKLISMNHKIAAKKEYVILFYFSSCSLFYHVQRKQIQELLLENEGLKREKEELARKVMVLEAKNALFAKEKNQLSLATAQLDLGIDAVSAERSKKDATSLDLSGGICDLSSSADFLNWIGS